MITKMKFKIRQTKKPKPALLITALILIIGIVAIIAMSANRAPAPTLQFDGEKLSGVDVSSHNGDIDWQKMSESVDFAFIRVGYRGYGTGSINIDKNAKHNIKKATKNGIPVGVYFYSQAVNEEEAIEEAEFALDVIHSLDVTLPVVIDFEYACDDKGDIAGRLYEANLTKEQNTDLINAFCKTVEDAGYQSAVYASSSVYKNQINTDDLSENAVIWVAEYSSNLSYTNNFDIWQYSKTGKLEGNGSKYVDLNFWYVKE